MMFECLTQLWPQSVVTQALVVGSVFGLIAYNLSKKRYNLPPGPKGWPLIGILLEVRGTLLFRKLRDWSKTYGPVMKIQLGTRNVVVLSRIDVVTEALITRQADFAGRPATYVGTKISEGGKDIVSASYGPTWKLHRKIASKALRHYLMGDTLSLKVSQSLNITTKFMRKEEGAFDPFPYLSLSISNMMTGMLFNKISENLHSEYYKAYVVTLDDFMKEAGEGFLEDSIPLLRLCPTPRFRRVARACKRMQDAIRQEIAAHRETFNKDEIRDFTDALIQAQQEAEEGEDPILMSQITNTHMVMTIFDLVFGEHYLMGDTLSLKVSQSLNITTKFMRKEEGAFDPFPYLSLSISNMMTGMLFNKISENLHSEYYKAYVVTLDDFMKEAGEGFLEDSIPLLRLCPTPRFRRVARACKRMQDAIRQEIAAHRETFNKDEIRDFTDALIQAQQEAEEGEDPILMSQITNTHMVMTIFDLVFAGTETSRSTLHWCLLTMALHPDVQKKVHEEVDSVIGPDLNVHVSDRENLPYTDAVIHEVMRLRTVVPMGVPHSTLCDTTVGGHDVPKGTMVIINHDALHFDPDQWEDVNTFKPERFLDSDGKMGPKPDSWLPFSAGRRVCLGETVAKPEIHLFLAGILRVFMISLAPGTHHDFEPRKTGDVNTPGRYELVMKSRI